MHDQNFVGVLSLIQYADQNMYLLERQLLNWIRFFILEGGLIFQRECSTEFNFEIFWD